MSTFHIIIIMFVVVSANSLTLRIMNIVGGNTNNVVIQSNGTAYANNTTNKNRPESSSENWRDYFHYCMLYLQ